MDNYITLECKMSEIIKDLNLKKTNKKGFKGNNFLTENIIGYYQLNDHKIEISYGYFIDNYLIGITFLNDINQKYSRSFNYDNLKDLKEYLISLKSKK